MARHHLPGRAVFVSGVLLALVVGSALPGCGRTTLRGTHPSDAGMPEDGGPRDSGPPRDVGPDAPRDVGPDAPRDVGPDARDVGTDTNIILPCTTDRDCDDGFVCDGVERCSPMGCVAGESLDCPSSTCGLGVCSESIGGCTTIPRDDDGDGDPPFMCGGGDCDDTNPGVSSRTPERCSGGVDDDCDGFLDCADSECARAVECVGGPCPDREVGSAIGMLSRGTTIGAGFDATGTCRDSTGAPELAFRWTAPMTGAYAFDTRGSAFDTVLYVRAGTCMGPELGCDDDLGGGLSSLVRLPLNAGDTVILFVDGFGTNAGDYVLNVSLDVSTEICGNGVDDDRDGLTDCGDPDCASAPICCVPGPESCTNGADDDCDSAIDCADPDCVSAPACCVPASESCTNGRDDDCDLIVDCADPDCTALPICCVPRAEDCSNGRDDDCDMIIDCADSSCTTAPVCCAMRTELCSNMTDDDCDGRIDCMDPDCTIAPVCLPACPERDLGSATGASIATGTTVGAGNDQMATCGGRATGPDVTFGWTAPRSATYVFDTIGSTFDTVLHLHDGSCTGPEIGCDDDAAGMTRSRITTTIRGGQRIVIVMDGFGMQAGSFVLNLRPVANEMGRCGDGIDNDADGFIDCVDSDCASEPTCCVPVPEVCTDGIDNDCDRVTDCADPNCRTSPSCCMPLMESCTNFADDDCDGFVDCVDSDCAGRPPC